MEKIDAIMPLSLAYGYEDGERMFFVTASGRIEIKGCNEVLRELLPLCDGSVCLAQVIDQLSINYEGEDLALLIKSLLGSGILCDGLALYEQFHAQSNNPMTLLAQVTESDLEHWSTELERPVYTGQRSRLIESDSLFLANARRRLSTREFSEPRGGLEKVFQGLLLATYSLGDQGKYTIPSGGALYPVRQYCIVLDASVGLPTGTYYIDPDTREAICIREYVARDSVRNCFFGHEQTIDKACLIQVLTANVRRSTQKYGNRGYRYCIMEVGHAAQNANLFATENNLGIVEVAGYKDKVIADFVGIDYQSEKPLITLMSGEI